MAEGSKLCEVWEALRVTGDNVDESRRWWMGGAGGTWAEPASLAQPSRGREGFSATSLLLSSDIALGQLAGLSLVSKCKIEPGETTDCNSSERMCCGKGPELEKSHAKGHARALVLRGNLSSSSGVTLLTSKETSERLCQGCACKSSRPEFVYKTTSQDSSHMEKT